MDTQPADAGTAAVAEPGKAGRPFKPGQSGNPLGRPRKGTGLQEWLDLVARRPHVPGGASYAEQAALMLWTKAARGEIEAVRYVFDRVLGKPMQSVALSTDTPPLMFVLVPPGTQPAPAEAPGTQDAVEAAYTPADMPPGAEGHPGTEAPGSPDPGRARPHV